MENIYQLSALSRRRVLRMAITSAAVLLPTTAALARRRSQSEPPAPAPASKPQTTTAAPLFKISLAQWSLHRMLQAGKLDHLDFPKLSKETYGIDAVEYVSAFFKKRGDADYTKELRKRCDDLGVSSVLIMVDNEGALGDPDDKKRALAVENHRPWLEAAKALGCHSIRVNAQSSGKREEQEALAAAGLRALCEQADPLGLNVIVENHGGLSSHGDWLAAVMKRVAHPRIGTLPDFGNFYEYDRYQGVKDLMPFAKGVSAKSHDFDENTGEEHKMDYTRLLRICLGAGYRGHIGIEYEGGRMSEDAGIRATKKLLERLRETLAPEFATPANAAPAIKDPK
ncbi:MAG: sugar phosphate isomerase/epimerase family protein [Phycisphaerales bacterium]